MSFFTSKNKPKLIKKIVFHKTRSGRKISAFCFENLLQSANVMAKLHTNGLESIKKPKQKIVFNYRKNALKTKFFVVSYVVNWHFDSSIGFGKKRRFFLSQLSLSNWSRIAKDLGNTNMQMLNESSTGSSLDCISSSFDFLSNLHISNWNNLCEQFKAKLMINKDCKTMYPALVMHNFLFLKFKCCATDAFMYLKISNVQNTHITDLSQWKCLTKAGIFMFVSYYSANHWVTLTSCSCHALLRRCHIVFQVFHLSLSRRLQWKHNHNSWRFIDSLNDNFYWWRSLALT